jgi:hypothetical protein
MNDENKDGWISVDDALPKIRKKVETAKLIDGVISQICENCLDIHTHCCSNYILFCYKWIIPYYNPTHWREIREKRPDFSKLNSKDLIIINDICAGYFNLIGDEEITISMYAVEAITHTIPINNIKKITRINLEEQTFEEI